MGKKPRIKQAKRNHIKAPYPLNQFPKDFAQELGKHIVAILATRPPESQPRIEGKDWEYIFAQCINAEWTPSNVGLDDVVFPNHSTAWSAKSIKKKNPHTAITARLISGRNDPMFSQLKGKIEPGKDDPNELGEHVISIWNARVDEVSSNYQHLRTVVLLKLEDLTKVSVFEFETTKYEADRYLWRWNERNNLDGYFKEPESPSSAKKKFTWQPHGSQFTIIEKVPRQRLKLSLHKPGTIPRDDILGQVDFEPSWIQIVS